MEFININLGRGVLARSRVTEGAGSGRIREQDKYVQIELYACMKLAKKYLKIDESTYESE